MLVKENENITIAMFYDNMDSVILQLRTIQQKLCKERYFGMFARNALEFEKQTEKPAFMEKRKFNLI